jgi:Protein of unknown function (DUF2809)
MQLKTNDQALRPRLIYLFCILFVICLGLASRSKLISPPEFIAAYAGDTLWALMVFLSIGVLFPGLSTLRVALVATALTATVETSQLYHATWLDAIRRTRLGALALGQGFLWSDPLCYAVGISFGVLADLAIEQVRVRKAVRLRYTGSPKPHAALDDDQYL